MRPGMKSIVRFCAGVLIIWAGICAAHAADPVVSSVRASQRAGTRLVDIAYDVAVTGDEGFAPAAPGEYQNNHSSITVTVSR